MSAETNESSGGSSRLRSTTTSQQSTQALSSKEEGSEGMEESSKEDSPLSDEKEYLEEGEYLDQETHLNGKACLHGQDYLEEKEYLQEEKGPEGNDYLTEEEYLERGECLKENLPTDGGASSSQSPGRKNIPETEPTPRPAAQPAALTEFKAASSPQTPPHLNARTPEAGLSQMTTFLTAPPPTSEPSSKPPYYDAMPSTSFLKDDGEFLGWQDQGTQTEWIYESKAPVKSKLKAEKERSAPVLSTLNLDLEEHIIPELQEEEKENFWDDTLNAPTDTPAAKDTDGNLPNASDQSVFRALMEEMAACSDLEEDTDIPLTSHLENETKRKLGLLMKKNFARYKKAILWIMKKRENLLDLKASDTCTFTFHLRNQSPQVEESKGEEAEEPRHTGHQEKKLAIDTQWVKSKVKVPQADVKLTLYPDENIFQILFPDGSGQIHYPSGHLAVLILSTKERTFTYEYIVLEDGKNGCVRALTNHTGHATFYDENGEIWLSLSQNLGYYFAKGKAQKAWNWWDLSRHVHAPPVQSICLNINEHIKVQIRSQDEITFRFTHQTKHVCLNLGTKYKFITPEVLSERKKAAILEVEVGSTAQKMHSLLGKMSKILNFLTVFDLENFLEATKILVRNNVSLRRVSCSPG